LEAYCVKCKEKREMENLKPDFNASGAPITRGTCPECSTRMVRIGNTEAHEGLTPPPKKKRSRTKRSGKLVIVESPAKARTVGRFLGKGYTVKASVGHVRDLLRSSLSVDVENDFTPKYRVPNEKRPIVKELKADARKAAEIYLATDPDREGEAIAWHLLEAAEMEPERTKRVVFHEITKSAIEESFNNPKKLDMQMVDAQQARRILDRLVGYGISPLLWQKVRSRLSAGRVQSVALRLVVEREREIDAFVPEEYWTIKARLKAEGGKEDYLARLTRVDGKEPSLPTEESIQDILKDMEAAQYKIAKIKRGVRNRKPNAPFITSTLQQQASRRLGYTAKRTMALAQQLYEGIDVGGGGQTGLITYMRTDSTHIAKEAASQARNYIIDHYGKDYVPEKPHFFKTSAKSAQEAHEAIRPTSVLREPKAIKGHLTRDQFRLYQLIWQGFMASQMASAVFDTLTIEIDAKGVEHQYKLRTSGSTMRFAGFLVVFADVKNGDKLEGENGNGNGNDLIPDGLEEGQRQNLINLIPEQHFTQPPPRFTDATLVATLEEHGIGRPSTYASILSTIQDRGYAYKENKRLFPTETGILVNDLLVQYFEDIINTGFSASMEEELDGIAGGEKDWVKVVSEFYEKFSPELEHARKEMPETKAELEKIGRACPKCEHDLVIRWGRFGKFISCSNFPACRYTEPWLEKIGVHCPKCSDGEIVKRRTRKGRIFYGCANYPECDFTSWKMPIPEPCPNCKGMLVIQNKREVLCLDCEEAFLLEQIRQTQKEQA
jgi:DNA topoisomerase I